MKEVAGMTVQTLAMAASATVIAAAAGLGVVQLASSTPASGSPAAASSVTATSTTTAGTATGASSCGNCQGNQGNGAGNGGAASSAPATPPTKYLSVPNSGITLPALLVPGQTDTASVTVVNENSGTTSVQSISGAVNGLPAICGVTVTTLTIPGGFDLTKKGGSHVFQLPIAMQSTSFDQSSCKNLPYSITFTASASGK